MIRAALVFLAAGLSLLVMACSAKATPTPTLRPTATPTKTSVTTPTTSAPTATTAATPAPATDVTPVSLFLNVTSPADSNIINTAEIDVKGQTTADAAVTVNNQVATVDSSGNFSAHVKLVEGPNTLEVISSDFQGKQVSQVVTVIYVPA